MTLQWLQFLTWGTVGTAVASAVTLAATLPSADGRLQASASAASAPPADGARPRTAPADTAPLRTASRRPSPAFQPTVR